MKVKYKVVGPSSDPFKDRPLLQTEYIFIRFDLTVAMDRPFQTRTGKKFRRQKFRSDQILISNVRLTESSSLQKRHSRMGHLVKSASPSPDLHVLQFDTLNSLSNCLIIQNQNFQNFFSDFSIFCNFEMGCK